MDFWIKAAQLILSLSILVVLHEFGHFIPEEKKENSLLYTPVKAISTTTIPGMDASTIFIKNAFKAESDSTGLTVEEVLRAKEVADSLGIDANDAVEIKRVHDEYIEKKD